MAHILVAEDSKAMRDVITRILQNADHSVVAVEDGKLAQEAARKEKFDIVLTDVHMPEKSGMALVASLRVMQGYERVPILLITTESSDTMKEKSKKLGANGWLTKPIDATRVLTAVEKTLAKFNK